MKKMIAMAKPFINDKIVMGSAIISISIFIGSIINYTTQIYLGRSLSVEDYGTFNSLFSLTAIIGIPSGALFASLIKTVSNLRIDNDFESITAIFKRTTGYLTIIGLTLGTLVLLFKMTILNYLNISEQALIYPFSLFILFSLLNNVPGGYLQGLLRFKGFGFYTICRALLRIVIVAIFISAGLKTIGALYGVTVSAMLSYTLGFMLLKKNFTKITTRDISKHFKKLLAFSFTVLIIRASLTLISSVDLILVKHFFDTTQAGIYAGVITIGKILLFGTSIIGTVMFTIISDSVAKKSNYMKKFIAFLAAQTIIVVGSVLIFYIFPSQITHVMFGKSYELAIAYLPKYGLAIGLFSFVNFIYQFLLAVDGFKYYSILIAGVLIQFILINLIHTSLHAIININIFTMCFILIAAIIPFKKVAFRKL